MLSVCFTYSEQVAGLVCVALYVHTPNYTVLRDDDIVL